MAKKITSRIKTSVTPQVKEPVFRIDTKFQKTAHSDLLSKLSPHIKLQMEELLQHEDQIVKRLKNAKQAQLLAQDPLAFFSSAKIPLSPIIRKRMEAFRPEVAVERQQFVLPNGQLIQPNIRINIKEK